MPTSFSSESSATRGGTWQGLLDRGVLVRDVGLPGWLRVTAGTEDETSAFLDALRQGMATTDGEAPE